MNNEPLLLMHSKRNVDETYKLTSQYLKDHYPILEEIHNHYWALHYVWDVIPQDETTILSSSHTFPAIESESKFDSAIQLALEGFYYESILVLKSCYELGLLSIFYNHDDSGPTNIESWVRGQTDTPFMNELKKGLKKIQAFIDFDAEFDLFNDLDMIYRTLNNYSHTRGVRHSARGIARRSNVNHFEEAAFSEWWRVACAVSKTIVLVHAIRYPLAIKKLNLYLKFGIDIPFGYFLDDGHVDIVRIVLSSDRLEFIESLLEKDDLSQTVIKDVMAKPDMTDEDHKQQIFEMNQMEIRHHPDGYNGWLQSHKTIYKRLGDENYAQFMKDAQILKKWAEKNGVLKGSNLRAGG